VSWTQRTSGTSNWLNGVAYGNGLFVAVGWDDTILTSPDAVICTPRTTATRTRRGSGAYGARRFVAGGGNGGTILTSPDGVSWTRRTSGTSNWLNGVAYGNGLFVAVGWNSTILTSP
jgi:hypothetical protein